VKENSASCTPPSCIFSITLSTMLVFHRNSILIARQNDFSRTVVAPLEDIKVRVVWIIVESTSSPLWRAATRWKESRARTNVVWQRRGGNDLIGGLCKRKRTLWVVLRSHRTKNRLLMTNRTPESVILPRVIAVAEERVE